MLLLPLPQFRRRRRPNSPSAPPPPAPLQVLAITDPVVNDDQLTVTIVLNTTEAEPINDPQETADPLKWSVRYQNLQWGSFTMSKLAYNQLSLLSVMGSEDVGADQVSYRNNPSDIGDALGRMLAACVIEF